MNINDSLNDIGRKSLVASNQVKNFTSEEKNNLLTKIAEKINSDKELILNANPVSYTHLTLPTIYSV